MEKEKRNREGGTAIASHDEMLVGTSKVQALPNWSLTREKEKSAMLL
jgi:hypothetical protein